MPYIHTMLKNRFIPALGIALLVPLVARAQMPPTPSLSPAPSPPAVPAQGPPTLAPANEPPTEAEKTIDAAAARIAALKSVAADVSQTVSLLDQEFTVKGRYLRAPNHRIYLRLTVTGLPDATGTLLQVCDGQTLFDYSQILDGQQYRKVEVGQIFEKLKSPDLEDELRNQIITQLGFAGPEQLLTGLRKVVKFNQEKKGGVYEGKDVWEITGDWKSRDGLLPPGQQTPTLGLLPPYIPSLVKVYLGKADGWPYKVEFVGRKSSAVDLRKIGPDGRPTSAKSSIKEVKPTQIDLVYGNVQFNPELKIEEFVFTAPAGAQVLDATSSLVAALDQAIQQRVLQKKAEAARNETPSLPQSIEVPRSTVPPAEPFPPPTNPGR